MKILIIEDENLLANELKKTLQRICLDCEILGVIKSVEQGKDWFSKNITADLIISDIQLADGSSFELFKYANTSIPIIFTTAYDDYAIRAFKLNSLDYLLKPIEDEALDAAIKKYRNLWGKKSNSITGDILNQLIETRNQKEYRNNFLVRIGDQYKRVQTQDISFFFAEGNTVFLVKKDNKKLIIDFSLEQISYQLDPKEFFRVNRNLLVCSTCITKIHKYFNSRLKLEITPKHSTDVLVTRSRVNGFLSWLNY